MNGIPPRNHHLVIFAKSPRLGRVKSRLARDIGRVGAWQFYRHNLRRIVRRMIMDNRWQTWIAITPDSSSPGIADLLVNPFVINRGRGVINQGKGNLGERMHRTVATLPPGPVVIIGTDIPTIQRVDVARAFKVLGRHDAVIGPATDGGYWLVGLNRRPRLPSAFVNVRWSGPHALADTVANLRAQSCNITMLQELEDVDDGHSYRRWKKTEIAVTRAL